MTGCNRELAETQEVAVNFLPSFLLHILVWKGRRVVTTGLAIPLQSHCVFSLVDGHCDCKLPSLLVIVDPPEDESQAVKIGSQKDRTVDKALPLHAVEPDSISCLLYSS